MNLFSFLLYYLILVPISLLPFWMLYGLSNFVFFMIYHVIGYRKEVVLNNIKNSFPNKTEKEHIEIQKKFFRHLCDLIVESVKAFTISEKQIAKRMVFVNPEVVNDFYDKKQSVILAGGHYNNWELFAVAIDNNAKHQVYGLYTPLSNKYFDNKIQESRGKYGLKLIPGKKAKQIFEENRDKLMAMIFGFDQSPSNPKTAHWMKFLNQDTGVLFGTELMAKKYNYPVIYGRIMKVKRGYYTLEWEKVCEDPSKTEKGEITRDITTILEKDINADPQYWLWSHRRWKHEKPADK